MNEVQRIVKAIGLPKRTIWFSIKYHFDEPTVVEAEYYLDDLDEDGNLYRYFTERTFVDQAEYKEFQAWRSKKISRELSKRIEESTHERDQEKKNAS